MRGQKIPPPETELSEDEGGRLIQRLTRRSLLVGGLATAAAVAGWRWAKTRPDDGGTPWPFREVLEMNRRLAGAAFNHNRLAPTFTGREASVPRANGDLGLKAPLDMAAWRLRVENSVHGDVFHLSLEELRGMPETAFSTYLYCIEGWSDIGHWKGVRLLDFLMLHPPRTKSGRPPDPLHHPEDLPRYVSLATPDGGYFVGIDMAGALHPQTMLCYEMGGKPLTPEHGAPLRLYTPVKYGIKSLKRIGTITYTDDRPRDYWAERGYDWYAGL